MGMWLCLLWLSTHGPLAMHHVDLSKAGVVNTQLFVTTRCLLKSWHIQHHPDTLNDERGTLPREYTALLDLLLTTYIPFYSTVNIIHFYHSYIPLCLMVFTLHFIILLTLFIQHFSTCHIIYCHHFAFKWISASLCHHSLTKVAACY